MKKVFKIIGACFLMCGVIALIVCMCAIPNETKLFFDSVFDYLDRPIVLCGVSVTLGGILGYLIVRYVLHNTSYGKKQINELKKELEQQKDRENADYKKLKDNFDYFADNVNLGFEDFEHKLEEQKKALSLIPNKKVQEALNNGKETKDN